MSFQQMRVLIERIRLGIAQRVGFETDLLNSADSIEMLHPGETVFGSPCIALPDQYDRVNAGAFGMDLAEEIAKLRGAPYNIGPTTRYVLNDVLVDGGVMYRNGKAKFFNHQVKGNWKAEAWSEHNEASVRSSFVGCHFFGHWLRDDSATHLMLDSNPPMSMPTPHWPDQAGYLTLFKQTYTELDRAHVRRLVLFDDISQNAHKVERFRKLRAVVATAYPDPSNTGRIVYLMRGPGGKERALLNEEEVIGTLARHGVTILRAETLTVSQLVKELFRARIIISVEGSQLSHALYTLTDHGGVLVIQPPDRFFNSHMDWALALNMRYACVVGRQRPTGFDLPVNDLLRTLELLDSAVA
jgi:hypothetical protein